LCKTFDCQAVVSNDVFKVAALSTQELPVRETAIRGRGAAVLVHPIEQADHLAVSIQDGAAKLAQPCSA
jgi:hypothetical protein